MKKISFKSVRPLSSPEVGCWWERGSPVAYYKFESFCSLRNFKRSIISYIGLELLIYIILYYIIQIIYRALLTGDQKKTFETYVEFFNKQINPLGRDLTFLLGFYVSLVAKRWWDQYKYLPWPDNLAIITNGLFVIHDESSKALCLDMLRYVLLSFILCLKHVSPSVQREFPNDISLIESGFASREEVMELDQGGSEADPWWIPLAWAAHLVKVAKKKKYVPSDHKELLREIARIRQNLHYIENHHHTPIPPVYKQVIDKIKLPFNKKNFN